MGLDNYPQTLPCKSGGTAVLDDEGLVLCKETQQAGGCPWLNANPPEEGRVYGIFGADCWYRGKYGNYLLSQAGIDGYSFYGDNEDQTHKSPESCLTLADVIGESLVDISDAEVRSELAYAEWYLRWAAENADGLECWY